MTFGVRECLMGQKGRASLRGEDTIPVTRLHNGGKAVTIPYSPTTHDS